jgi:hypothetical protein
MPKLQCPKCKHPIELKSMPADNRVRCANCKAEFSLKAPAPKQAAASGAAAGVAVSAKPTQPVATSQAAASKASTAARPATRPVDPNDPFASIDLNSLGKGNRVDLGVAPIATGVVESPQSNMAPWLPGNSAAYVPLTEEEAAALTQSAGKGGSKASLSTPSPVVRPKSNMGITIAVASLLVLMAGGAIVAAVVVSKSGSGGSTQAAKEKPTFRIPDGFEVITLKGVDGIIPKNEDKKSKVPGGFDGRIARSSKTGSYFLFCVTDQLGGEINQEKVSKAARGMLHGDILGGSEITVAGYKGWQGSHATGVFLPERMAVEMIPIEDRFIVRGYITASSMQSGFDPDAKFDYEAEKAEVDMFKESIYIGKKPGMFGF